MSGKLWINKPLPERILSIFSMRGYVQAGKENLSIFSMFLFVLQISNSSRVGFIKLRGFINATAAERVFTGR